MVQSLDDGSGGGGGGGNAMIFGAGDKTLNATGSSVTYYISLQNGAYTADEYNIQFSMPIDATVSKFIGDIRYNSLNAETTWRTRDAGSDGNQSFTIAALTSGTAQDTSNEDELHVGDKFDYSITTASTSGHGAFVSTGCKIE